MMRPLDEKTQTQLYVVSSLVILVAVIFLTVLYFVSGIKITDLLPGCIFYEKYHLFCPGCGGTRAVICLLQGDIIGSFLYHPFVVYAAVVYGLFWTSNVLYSMSIIDRRYSLRPVHFIAAIGIIILQCLVKNIWVLAAV